MRTQIRLQALFVYLFYIFCSVDRVPPSWYDAIWILRDVVFCADFVQALGGFVLFAVLCGLQMRYNTLFSFSPDGGIGRHKGLKIPLLAFEINHLHLSVRILCNRQ